MTRSDRAQLKRYSTVLSMWAARFNTAEIAAETGIAEHLVCRWIWSYREMARGAAA